jgi:hypothetical protein
MDRFEKQRRIFTIDAVFLIVSVMALIAVIPRLIQEISPDGIPKAAAIATSVAMGVRLLILLGILYGIRLTKRNRRINNEINLAVAIVLLLLGFVLMDGAFAYADSLLFVSIGMFICVFCDFAVVVVSIVALFQLRKKKQKQAG